MKPLTKIKNFRVHEVSVVDKGANLKKRFPIVKEQKMDVSIVKDVLDVPQDNEKEICGEGDNSMVLKSFYRLLAGFKDKLPAEEVLSVVEKAGYVTEKPKQEEEPVAKAKDMPKGMKGKKSEDEDEEEDAMKSDEMKKQLEEISKAYEDKVSALQKQNEEITKALKAEQEARALAVWKERAQKDLEHYPGLSFDEMAKQLHDFESINKEFAEKQFTQMKTVSETVKNSQLMAETHGITGVTKAAGGTAWDKLEEMAKSLVEKSNDLEMTPEKALTKVLESPIGKTLYNQYLNENEAQNS